MKTLKQIAVKTAVIIPLLLVLVAPVMVGATNHDDTTNNPIGSETGPIESVGQVQTLVGSIVNWAQGLLFAFGALFIIIAGFQYLTAAGNPEKVENAKNNLIYSLIAIALGLVAFGIDAFLYNVLTTGAGS